jgi:Protein of unknown function (DUF1573)
MNVYFLLISLFFNFFQTNKVLKSWLYDEIIYEIPSTVKWVGELEHNFGDAKKGSILKHAFKFQNIGNQPITVETARTTCGCTAASWTQTPIAPNESGEILIEYDSNKTGDFRKKIKVFFHQQKKAETLWVTGSVE